MDGEGDQFDAVRKLSCSAFEEDSSEILCGRNHSLEKRDFDVEVTVVDVVDDRSVEDLFEVLHVYEIAAVRVGVTLDNRFDDVVMAVTVRVVALAEDSLVPVVQFRRVMEPVGRFEVDLDGDCGCHCSPFSLAQTRPWIFRANARQSSEC